MRRCRALLGLLLAGSCVLGVAAPSWAVVPSGVYFSSGSWDETVDNPPDVFVVGCSTPYVAAFMTDPNRGGSTYFQGTEPVVSGTGHYPYTSSLIWPWDVYYSGAVTETYSFYCASDSSGTTVGDPVAVVLLYGAGGDTGSFTVESGATIGTPPTTSPSTSPTTSPSTSPTTSPSTSPTTSPSTSPTTSPSTSPTTSPSTSPTTTTGTVEVDGIGSDFESFMAVGLGLLIFISAAQLVASWGSKS